MNAIHELPQIIADLVRINKDRAEHYEGILNGGENLHHELIQMINRKINESHRNIRALNRLIKSYDIDFSGFGIAPGKIFITWSASKNERISKHGSSDLSNCSFDEEAVLEAYRTALVSEALNHVESRKMLMDQKFSLQTFANQINRYRDLQYLSYQPVFLQ